MFVGRDKKTCAERIERVRSLMEERSYDAVVLCNLADLRWLTGVARTFDTERAHVAFLTRTGLWLHTDSRYYTAFVQSFADDSSWEVDEAAVQPTAWVAERIYQTRSRVIAIEDSVEVGFLDRLEYELTQRSLACFLPRLHNDLRALRAVKDASELELLRAAQRVTDDAFHHIRGYIKPGMTEKQVRVELESYMLSHGADAISFDSIVASGPNGAVPHAQPSDRAIEKGDLLVLDYGASVGDYHADMTRTVAIGEPSEKQRHVYEAVRCAHEGCARAIHAGVKGSDIHELSVKIIAEAGFGDYYRHALGHGVGIEIHEDPCFGPGYTKSIPAGAVITVEPGIYLPQEFGIRLEDCGLVTETGFEPFTECSHDLYVIA